MFQAFGEAYNLVEMPEKVEEPAAPYLVKNDTGTDITVRPDGTFKVSTHHYSANLSLFWEYAQGWRHYMYPQIPTFYDS